MNFNTADVAGVRLFYREAGDPSKPTIVLLHGFPSLSYTFHDLGARRERRRDRRGDHRDVLPIGHDMGMAQGKPLITLAPR
jgi:pimeloyl-ACP methyl ester carboxylesterase